MEMKKILRSGLAILCSISLVLSCFGMLAPTVQAAETLPTGFTEVTPKDFGIDDFSDNTAKTLYQSLLKPIHSADKVMVSANVVFGGTDSKITLLDNSGQGETGKGIYLIRKNDGIRLVNSYTGASFYIGGQFVEGAYQGDAYTGTQWYYDMTPLSSAESYDTTEIALTITMELVTFNTSGTNNDLKVGIWFDNVLYNDTYVYFRDFTVGTNNIYMDMNVLSVTSPKAKEKLPTDFGEVTPKDFGINNFSNNTELTKHTSTLAPVTSVDKVMLSADIVFGQGSTIYYCEPFAEGYSGGIGLWAHRSGNNMRFYNYAASWGVYVGGEFVQDGDEATYTGGTYHDARFFDFTPNYLTGTNTFDATEVSFKMTTQLVDFDKDGSTDDLKIGLWFDGVLQDNTYVYLRNCSVAEKPYISMAVKSCTSPTITTEPPVAENVYGELTPAALGVPNTTNETEGVTLTTPEEDVQLYNLDKTKFSANVHFQATKVSSFTYLYNEAGRGQIKLIVNPNASSSLLLYNYKLVGDTTLYVGDKIATGVDIEESYQKIKNDETNCAFILGSSKGCNFLGKNCLISVTTEFVDFDGDGDKDDLEIGIFIDGDTYEPTYCYYKDYEETTFKGILKTDNLISIFSPEITNPATPVTPTVEPPADPEAPPTFPEITFSDFEIDDGTYGYNGVDFATSGSYKDGFANKTFVGTVKYSEQQSTSINFAGKGSAWEGIRFLTRNGNQLYFTETYGRFESALIEVDDEFTWKDRHVDIRLVFEVTDLDVDGAEDDVRFWLSLDGELYKNKPIVKAIDYAQYLGNFLGIYSDNEGSTVTVTSADIERPTEEIDFGMMGFTKDWEKTLASGSRNSTTGVVSNKAPHTGDGTMTTTYLIICIVSLVVLGGVLYSKRYDKKETN